MMTSKRRSSPRDACARPATKTPQAESADHASPAGGYSISMRTLRRARRCGRPSTRPARPRAARRHRSAAAGGVALRAGARRELARTRALAVARAAWRAPSSTPPIGAANTRDGRPRARRAPRRCRPPSGSRRAGSARRPSRAARSGRSRSTSSRVGVEVTTVPKMVVLVALAALAHAEHRDALARPRRGSRIRPRARRRPSGAASSA